VRHKNGKACVCVCESSIDFKDAIYELFVLDFVLN